MKNMVDLGFFKYGVQFIYIFFLYPSFAFYEGHLLLLVQMIYSPHAILWECTRKFVEMNPLPMVDKIE